MTKIINTDVSIGYVFARALDLTVARDTGWLIVTTGTDVSLLNCMSRLNDI